MADTVKISELPIATTVSGGETIPIVQSGTTKQLNVEDIFDVVDVPLDAAAYWPLDEVPEIPDKASGIGYLKPDWRSAGGWVQGGVGALSFPDANTARVTAGVADATWDMRNVGGFTAFSPATNHTVKIRLRASKGMTIGLLWNTTGALSKYFAITTEWRTYDIPVAADTNWTGQSTITGLYLYHSETGTLSGDWFEVQQIYAGTGAYTTPAIDASGHGFHLIPNGPTPDGNGNLILDGINDFLKSANALNSIPDVQFFEIDFPMGNAQKAAYQVLVNYNKTSGTVGFLWIMHTISADSLQVRYATGSVAAIIFFNDLFTGFDSSALRIGISINWITGVVTVYRNGVLFGTQIMTTPVKPLAGSYLYFGVYQGTLYFLEGTLGDLYYYTRALSAVEVLGLYKAKTLPKAYSLINWQNSYMIDSTIPTSAFAITAASGYILPRGKYEFSATSPSVQLQFLSGSTWYGASYLSGQVCADGVNVRAYNPTASGVTVYYRKLDL